MDAAVSLAFLHFGFGGWKEYDTGYCSVWQISYHLGYIVDSLFVILRSCLARYKNSPQISAGLSKSIDF